MKPGTTSGALPLLPQPVTIPLLLTVGTLFASNHVAARIAFDDGVGLLLALLVRTAVALALMLMLVVWQRHRLTLAPGQRRWQLLLGLMIAGQSLCLYSAVARVPVAVALLLVNTWPIFLALLTWLFGGGRPSARLATVMAIILAGLVLVLDIPAWLARPGAMGPEWLPGAGFALAAALFFSVAIWTTENRLGGMPGAVRSVFTMVGVLALMAISGALGLVPGGLSPPATGQGWLGLVLLAAFYGLASTVLFVLIPRLNMARNAPVMNFEPVASLLLGYLVLGQVLSPIQLTGGAIVLGCIIWLGTAKTR